LLRIERLYVMARVSAVFSAARAGVASRARSSPERGGDRAVEAGAPPPAKHAVGVPSGRVRQRLSRPFSRPSQRLPRTPPRWARLDYPLRFCTILFGSRRYSFVLLDESFGPPAMGHCQSSGYGQTHGETGPDGNACRLEERTRGSIWATGANSALGARGRMARLSASSARGQTCLVMGMAVMTIWPGAASSRNFTSTDNERAPFGRL
jgi:hypothetical protein